LLHCRVGSWPDTQTLDTTGDALAYHKYSKIAEEETFITLTQDRDLHRQAIPKPGVNFIEHFSSMTEGQNMIGYIPG
jgi:hypothetical protein